MNVSGTSVETMNVLPLFDSMEIPPPDLLEELLQETEDEGEPEMLMSPAVRKIVLETQFPDQSMFVLDEQLRGLKESLNRLKFYLGDLDDLLPK